VLFFLFKVCVCDMKSKGNNLPLVFYCNFDSLVIKFITGYVSYGLSAAFSPRNTFAAK